MFVTIIAIMQLELDWKYVVFGLFAALALTVILVTVDIFVSGNQNATDTAAAEEIEAFSEENLMLTRKVSDLEAEKETLLSEVFESRKALEALKDEAQQQTAVNEELKERVLELNNKLSIVGHEAADRKEFLKAEQQTPNSDYSADVYCSAVSQWAMDLVKPLRSIKKFAENTDDKDIIREADQLSGCVEKILYFSSIDSIETNIKNEKVVLNDILRDILKKYSTAFNEKKIGIFRKGLESIILTDKVWFVFGFSQLLSNAIYSTGDFGKISIMAKEDEQYVYLLLEDSSMGIHEEELKHIFEPGFVSEEARRISGNTTSTCLYLAKKAFDKIGNELTVDSIYGKGTKVMVRFDKYIEE